MSARDAVKKVKRNPAGMGGTLPKSSSSDVIHDWCMCFCCGIHGAARHRKGIKRGTGSARRRQGKAYIRDALENIGEES